MEGIAREMVASALRPAWRRVCVVMLCTDPAEAEQVARLITEHESGSLVVYRRVEDLFCNRPAGSVALVILANRDASAGLPRTLVWLRRLWPHCPVTVVGDAGCGEEELAARLGGAIFLTRPVSMEQWSAILGHVLGGVREGVHGRE